MGVPFPGCRSGRPTASRMPGNEAVFSSCCTAAPSIQLFGDAKRRTSGISLSFNEYLSLRVSLARQLWRLARRPRLVQERDLPCVLCRPLPVHVDAMPTIQMHGLVVT